MTDCTTTIGTTATGGKVHIAHGLRPESQRITCRFGRSTKYLKTTIATLTGEGAAATMKVLEENKIPHTKLCENCFTPTLRIGYSRHLRGFPTSA